MYDRQRKNRILSECSHCRRLFIRIISTANTLTCTTKSLPRDIETLESFDGKIIEKTHVSIQHKLASFKRSYSIECEIKLLS